MADWKNKDDYPPVKGTSLDRWAAEFLYRNPNFLSEMNDATDEEKRINKSQLPVGWSDRPIGKVLKKYGVKCPNVWGDVFDSPFLFNHGPEWVSSYTVEKAGGMFTESYVGKEFYIYPNDRSDGVLAFDLTQPIMPQLDRAKRMLLAKQKNFEGKKNTVKKAIVKLYPFYLRVLDAYSAGADSKEICDVLSLDYKRGVSDDTLRNWKLKAEQLRDGGYLDIVASPKP